MSDDKHTFYLKYLNKKVRITKYIGDKKFFYNGEVEAVLDEELVLIDKKIGQVIMNFKEIGMIEMVEVY